MSRDLPAALVAAIEQPVVNPFLALHIALPDPVYAVTGQGVVEFADANGDMREWTGAGGIGQIDTIGEATDGSTPGMRATLFNVPEEFRDDVAEQATRGAAFEVYVGAFNESFKTVEASQLIWKGRLDSYRISDGGSSLSVEVAGESRSIDKRRPAIKRFTDDYQQRKHPGDKFFEYVPQMVEIPILWAATEQKSAVASGGGGATGGAAARVSNIIRSF